VRQDTGVADIRVLLTDKTVAQLPVPEEGWYLARDTELKGFFVVIGKRKRTFTVQGDLRQDRKRASSIRVSIGDTSEMSTRTARATAKEYLAQISQGKHPKRPRRISQLTRVKSSRLMRARQRLRFGELGNDIWKFT